MIVTSAGVSHESVMAYMRFRNGFLTICAGGAGTGARDGGLGASVRAGLGRLGAFLRLPRGCPRAPWRGCGERFAPGFCNGAFGPIRASGWILPDSGGYPEVFENDGKPPRSGPLIAAFVALIETDFRAISGVLNFEIRHRLKYGREASRRESRCRHKDGTLLRFTLGG